MAKRTLPRYQSDAEEFRQRGFQVGDKLVGDEGYGPTVIQLTAIGERKLLAKEVSHNGVAVEGTETSWTLSERDWQKVV
jgi:hypothetical protein